MSISICPRGYNTARKYYYPFPTATAIEYAKKVCNGEEFDWTGLKEKSPISSNYISVSFNSNINGFNRYHAEQWVDVCTKKRCKPTYHNTNCVPEYRVDDKTSMTINEMSNEYIEELCSNYRPRYPNASELFTKIKFSGKIPQYQVVYKDETIGLLDNNGEFHISKPSKYLDGIDTKILE
jgi:hypothetical protein